MTSKFCSLLTAISRTLKQGKRQKSSQRAQPSCLKISISSQMNSDMLSLIFHQKSPNPARKNLKSSKKRKKLRRLQRVLLVNHLPSRVLLIRRRQRKKLKRKLKRKLLH